MSIRINPQINIDAAGIAMKIKKATEKSMQAVTDQIQVDCNKYAPYRSGALQGENGNERNIGIVIDGTKAELSWKVIYAPYVYKGISRSGKPLKYNKQPREQAGAKWCERAKSLHLSDWNSKLNDSIREHFKND